MPKRHPLTDSPASRKKRIIKRSTALASIASASCIGYVLATHVLPDIMFDKRSDDLRANVTTAASQGISALNASHSVPQMQSFASRPTGQPVATHSGEKYTVLYAQTPEGDSRGFMVIGSNSDGQLFAATSMSPNAQRLYESNPVEVLSRFGAEPGLVASDFAVIGSWSK